MLSKYIKEFGLTKIKRINATHVYYCCSTFDEMKPELKYIELKCGFGDNEPSWIGTEEFSKSGKTV